MYETIIDLLVVGSLGACAYLGAVKAIDPLLAKKGNLLASVLMPGMLYITTKLVYGNMALAIGVLGAATLLRYRSKSHSTLEITLLFVYIVIGLSWCINYEITLGFVGFLSFVYGLAASLKKLNIGYVNNLKQSESPSEFCLKSTAVENYLNVLEKLVAQESVNSTISIMEDGFELCVTCASLRELNCLASEIGLSEWKIVNAKKTTKIS